MQATLKNNFMPYHSSMSANTISPCHTANYFSDAKQVVVLGAFRLQYFMLQQGNVHTTVINVSVDTSLAALVFGPCQLPPTGRSIHINHRLTASFCQPSLKAEHQDTFNNRAASLISCIAVFVCFHGVNKLHTSRAGLAEEEEEAKTFVVCNEQEKLQIGVALLPQKRWQLVFRPALRPK